MQTLVAEIAEYYGALPRTELTAVILALAYLVLAIRQNIWCWFCAAISTAMYVYLFARANLYMESLLNVFYFGMAIYGWTVWRSGETDGELPVSVWPLQVHVYAVSGIIFLAAATGFLLAIFTDAAYPYIDSATTFAAVWATFLVARKILENWWYWLVIDVVSVFIYWTRGLEATAVLFIVYVVLIPIGLVAWTRSWRQHQPAAVPV
ncbi:MAG: nicotinamide mononucleotide transporter [Proteobacteria bacterium]|nr:nicotinamide mononucleotide transporter [Pseudomonadota bacterium]